MSKAPIVAIVGRPNVGKSTLFNRLTATRAALVSDLPGLTRDRREGEAKIGPVVITLVDTAGLEEAADGTIADRMRRQSETAVTSADLILFVIDARAGVTPSDAQFARLVRSSGKPVILVANKSEGRAGRDGFYDAFQLGLGDPLAISAEHGEGLGDLIDDVAAALGIKTPEPEKRRGGRQKGGDAPAVVEAEEKPDKKEVFDRTKRRIRVAIVGRPNAGKSTLVNALLGEDRMITGPEPGLTRDSIASDLTFHDQPVRLFDTAGLRKKARVTDLAEQLSGSDAIRAIRFAEVVVLLVDAERPLEHQDLTIAELVTEEGRALVIAVNKWDAVGDKQKLLKDIRSDVAQRLSQVPGVAVVPISALGEKGLDQLMKATVKAYETWNRRVSTSELNRWLADALSRHAPPAVSGRRVKIRFVTQPSARPPTFVAFSQRADALPQSYVRYLVNSLRDAFDLPGVPIRFNLRKSDNPFDRK